MMRLDYNCIILVSAILLTNACGKIGDIEEAVWGQEVKEEAVRISPEVSYELPDTIYAMSANVWTVCRMPSGDAEVFSRAV